MSSKRSSASDPRADLRAGVLVGLGLLLAGCGSEERPPNVLLITLDTTRADALSCLGGPEGTTPRLDALASDAALFTAAYSDSNVTNPSHLSILTGQPLIEHGVFSNLTPFPQGADGLPQAFQRAGYRTGACVAVRHLSQAGLEGFDTLLGAREGELRAEVMTSSAIAWLAEADDERPFFLWVHYFDPHTMYQPPPELVPRFYRGDPSAGDGPPIVEDEYFDEPRKESVQQLVDWLRDARDPAFPRAMYQTELFYTDRELGRLFDALGAQGRFDSTAIVVTADHGEGFGEHGIFYDHKGLTENQVHVPLIVRVPGAAPTRWDGVASNLDIAPTLAELCGLELTHDLAGTSLLPAVRGDDAHVLAERDTLVLQHAHNLQVALRAGRWKLICPIGNNRFLPKDAQLFDLEADPGEENDLAEVHPERVAEMRARLLPWIEIGPVKKGDPAGLSEEALEELRRLGYIEAGE